MLSRAVHSRRPLSLKVPTRVRQEPLRPDSLRPRWRDGRSLRQYGRSRSWQAQENSEGRTASRLHLTTAAMIRATIVGAADRAASRIVLLCDATGSQKPGSRRTCPSLGRLLSAAAAILGLRFTQQPRERLARRRYPGSGLTLPHHLRAVSVRARLPRPPASLPTARPDTSAHPYIRPHLL
jgi:hypothetical protein